MKGAQPGRLRAVGVELQEALPVGFMRVLFARTDLGNHRKIVIVDGGIAYTGSMNMVDPSFFKQEANVGEWVDAMVSIEGSAVIPLALTMIGDWMLERGGTIREIIADTKIAKITAKGNGDAQVVPSGPGETNDGLLQMLLATINSAKEELILTTRVCDPSRSGYHGQENHQGLGL